ncbi:HCP-like superfamily protein isoform X4 [Wolffia australiana]
MTTREQSLSPGLFNRRTKISILLSLLILHLSIFSAVGRPFIILITRDDLKDPSSVSESVEWDEFNDPDSRSEDELDPGSWRPIFESSSAANSSNFSAAASAGCPHSQSAMGFFYGTGIMRPLNRPKALLYHQFATDGGNMQSKMVLAYTYLRQEMYEEAVKLYEELAEAAVASFLISTTSSVLEPVRIHLGSEENKGGLRKSRGEEDDDFQIVDYQAKMGSAPAMRRLGNLYYFGLRGVRRDKAKALIYLLGAAESGEPESMELLGEIYARGAGVEKNYTKAYEWLKLSAQKGHYSAYNGLGYMYFKGYGVKRNYTKAKELFMKAAEKKVSGGYYNLGVLYLKGIGVERNVTRACEYLLAAATSAQPKALYQVAKMFQRDIGFKKNILLATVLYKIVAERGPWSSLSRWAMESYVNPDVRKALMLYLRMAELGYEVGQSNAAWILDRDGENIVCIGESGLCKDEERHLRAHSLWWKASEEGNEHAALLIGDAYFYGRGMEKDYVLAAEAYTHAKQQRNAQAMFNLGYMYEHGLGLPFDLHLAKRYYDQAVEADAAAKLPVAFALTSLWIRRNYPEGILVKAIDSLPGLFPRVDGFVKDVIFDEANGTIISLFVCLLTVLYLRERQRRQAIAAAAAAAGPTPIAPPEQEDFEPIGPH